MYVLPHKYLRVIHYYTIVFARLPKDHSLSHANSDTSCVSFSTRMARDTNPRLMYQAQQNLSHPCWFRTASLQNVTIYQHFTLHSLAAPDLTLYSSLISLIKKV